MASKRPRLECPGCGQNLSYSAYCRHQQLHNAASDVDSETDSDSSFSGELMATTSTSGDSLDNSDDGSYIGDGSCDQNLETAGISTSNWRVQQWALLSLLRWPTCIWSSLKSWRCNRHQRGPGCGSDMWMTHSAS